jgi:hypothetical protein
MYILKWKNLAIFVIAQSAHFIWVITRNISQKFIVQFGSNDLHHWFEKKIILAYLPKWISQVDNLHFYLKTETRFPNQEILLSPFYLNAWVVYI